MSAVGGISLNPELRADLMRVARREAPADLLMVGANLINVYSGEIHPADVAIRLGRIAFVGDATSFVANETVDLTGRFIAPGLVEPHAHPWVLYNPVSYAQAILPLGVTTVAADDIALRSTMRPGDLGPAFAAFSRLPLRYLWMLRIGNYGPFGEGAEGGGERIVPVEEIAPGLRLPGVIGVAELNRWLNIRPESAEILRHFDMARAAGQIVQGHTSGASQAQLNALELAGIDSCHEAIRPQEVLDRLRLGLHTMLRHSSLRPDLQDLLPALETEGLDTSRLMLTTDGSSPAHVLREGHIDGMVRQLVAGGVSPVTALQMATRNPAVYLGGDADYGGIAPGRSADILVLDAPGEFPPRAVFAAGRLIAAEGRLLEDLEEPDWQALNAAIPYADLTHLRAEDLLLEPKAGTVTAISYYNSVLTRSLRLELPMTSSGYDIRGREGLLHAALVARDGRFISRGLVDGLLHGVEGFATSYVLNGHLLALGTEPESMLQALREVVRMGGGFAAMEAGRPVWTDALPLYGVMTDGPFENAVSVSKRLEQYFQAHGYRFQDPAYSLFFLAGDFLPGPRLMARGVVDAKTGAVVHRAQPMSGPPDWRRV